MIVYQLMLRYCTLVVALVAFITVSEVITACESENDLKKVVIRANPPGIYKGETVNIKLSSENSFFRKKIKTPIISSGKLTLKNIVRKTDTEAIATFESTDDTTVGHHEFFLDDKGLEGELVVSVLVPDPGPGEVTANRNTGSSGAKYGFFSIEGKNTNFDKNCYGEVIGAEGFKIKYLDVVNPLRIDIYYSIDLEQPSADISIVLVDGDYRYEVPFYIVRHQVFENEIVSQSITKGAVGDIVVFNKNATFNLTTKLEKNNINLESGAALINPDRSVTIPVRVPFDYEDDSLILIANTYKDGGAFLEQIRIKVTLNEPSYFYLKNGEIDLEYREHERVFVINSENNWRPESIFIVEESGNVAISDWKMEGIGIGSLSILLRDGASEGLHTIIAENGKKQRLYSPFVVSSWNGNNAYIPKMKICNGDEIYLPVIVQGSDLQENRISVSSNEKILVSEVRYIDKNTLVLRVRIDDNAFPSEKQVEIESPENTYVISIPIMDSGL